jgi:hypothetical protein
MCVIALALDDMNGTRLRSQVPGFLDKANGGADVEFVETKSEDAVAMKVDQATVVRFDAAELAFAVDFVDTATRGVRMELDLMPVSSFIVLKPAACRFESVA